MPTTQVCVFTTATFVELVDAQSARENLGFYNRGSGYGK